MLIPQVIQEIRIAFEGVELQDGTTIHQALVIDNYENEEEQLTARLKDTYSRWQDIPELLIRTACPIIFMNAAGLKFHIPAYMIYVLQEMEQGKETDAIYSVLSVLRVGKTAGLTLFGDYTQQQIRAVILFLTLISESDCLEANEAYETLNKYWTQFV